jgi:hypothetical protein
MITIEQMVQREVLCCMSSLVGTLAKGFGTTLNPDHPIEGAADIYALWTQAWELAAPVLDYEEAATQGGWNAPGTKSNSPYWQSGMRRADNAQDACELDDIPAYEWEVYGHWAVTQWFAEKLIAQGERVDTDFAGLNIWARTTTGQAMRMDGVVQKIYQEMVK